MLRKSAYLQYEGTGPPCLLPGHLVLVRRFGIAVLDVFVEAAEQDNGGHDVFHHLNAPPLRATLAEPMPEGKAFW